MEQFDYEQLYRETVPSVVSLYRDAGGGGAGSGFVYDDDHVVTNEHVVRDRERVDVRFQDGDWGRGRVVGSDIYTDLAVVRLDDRPTDATPLSVADADAYPRPGQPVAALGNPLGLDGSVTTGIVSGVDRSMPTSGGFAIPDVVQTDAPINPGNSGGPLVAADADGYPVVGVNRAKSGDNIGFAVSARVVSTVVPTLIAEGRYSHAALQVRTLDVTPRIADANDLAEPRGVMVVDVREQTGGDPLRGARSRRRIDGRAVPVGGDVIRGMEGDTIRSHEELTRRLLTDARPGEPVALEIRRHGRTRTVETVPVERPVSTADRRRAGDRSTTIPLE
jgi:S1-C subfamily serine protease